MDPEVDSAFEFLYGAVYRLRVENEVNKVLIHALKSEILKDEADRIEAMLETIQFTSSVVEAQIKQSGWSDAELKLFKELIEKEKRLLSLLR
jgi:rubrerythrin